MNENSTNITEEQAEVKTEVIETKEVNEKVEESNGTTKTQEVSTKDKVETTDDEFKEDEKTEQETKNTETKKRDLERDKEQARLRRERETREKERKELERAGMFDGIKRALKNTNPFTQEEFDTDDDIEFYLDQVEMEKQGLDPTSLSDYKKYKKQIIEKGKDKPLDEKEWVINDSKEFRAKYPDVSFDEVFKDEKFTDYVDKYHKDDIGKTTPFAKIYTNFLTYQEERKDFDKLVEQKANEMFEKRMAKSQASVGDLSKTKTASDDYYTREQIDKMSTDEIRQNMTKVDKSIAYWQKQKK